jgi:monofunctional biosynthetic peptidoglycan transglycosylase
VASKRKKSKPRTALKWGGRILLIIFGLTLLQVISLRFINPPFTPVMCWNWLRGDGAGGLAGLRERWRPLKEISPHMRKAVLAGEDQRFLTHHGFDFVEINQAVRDMLWKGDVRGASTLTMQVARTVFLWPERSWLRKIAEAYYTLFIDALWPKGRILEVYLNTVDLGDGIVGVEAASERYFGVPANGLSPNQAALLTAILPSPHRWSPVKPDAQVRRRQRRILNDMEKMPLLS